MKHLPHQAIYSLAPPAAFGRLCVETPSKNPMPSMKTSQPPSGGCVLKQRAGASRHDLAKAQPPSGGCVLKQTTLERRLKKSVPAAFGRLCVETAGYVARWNGSDPAAFGRLCVETTPTRRTGKPQVPAAFGRLCVETGLTWVLAGMMKPPAAFGRLCVETKPSQMRCANCAAQPPSGGCVLKPRVGVTENFVMFQPPSGGCVLKHDLEYAWGVDLYTSRLRAAVC